MQLINPEKASHWYRATDAGVEPYYEMRGKNGSMRAPTIKDAREQGLLVSISRVAGMLPKPALNAWLQSQAILAAIKLPRLPDESDDNFAIRVAESFEAAGEIPMTFGSDLHAQIERELIKPGCPCPSNLDPFMRGVREWLASNVQRVLAVEEVVGDLNVGIGGKLDLLCEMAWPGNPPAVVDFKSQGIKNGKPKFYDEFPLQLVGYAQCIKRKGAYEIWPRLISVVVDSKTPGPAHMKVWDEPEHHWEIFLHCFEIFCYAHNYRPGKL